MAKGDIVLVTFPFTDLTGTKLRPAVVLVENDEDVTACFITTQLKWREDTDVVLTPSLVNGIKKDSLVKTSKIATLHLSLIKGLMGKLSEADLLELNNKLKLVLQLS